MKALELENRLEELEQMRSKWLFINLVGFVLWDGLRMIDLYILEELNPLGQILLWSGWLIWTVGLVQLTRLGFKVKKTKMATQILNDEWIELSRLKSWRLAFLAVTLTQVAIIVLNLFSFQISGIFAAELSIFVAVVSALLAFLYFNQEPVNEQV